MKKESENQNANPIEKTVGTLGTVPLFPELPEMPLFPDVFGEMEEMETQSSVYEIAPGATVEEVKALFFDATALNEAPQQIYRLDRAGHRYYYSFDENGNPDFYPSITTLISQTLPTSEFLIKWIAKKGYERAEEYKNERAKYGSFMHAEYAEMLIAQVYDLDRLKARLVKYMESNNLPFDFVDYADDLRKNMLSLAQFIIDYQVEPLAVEIPLIHPVYRFGATLDLPCYLTIRGERIRANIDFKSGKNFYEANEVQLHAQKEVWNYHFPNLKIDRVFNWRPKEWRHKPTYHFEEQTNSVNAQKLQHILAMAQIEDKKVDNMLTICNGVIDLKKGIDQNYKVYTLAELVKNKKAERTPAPDNTAERDNAVDFYETVTETKKDGQTKTRKKAGEAKGKAATGKKPAKVTNTQAKAEKPEKQPENAKKEESKKLLNEDLNI